MQPVKLDWVKVKPTEAARTAAARADNSTHALIENDFKTGLSSAQNISRAPLAAFTQTAPQSYPTVLAPHS